MAIGNFRGLLSQAIEGGARWQDLGRTVQTELYNNPEKYPEAKELIAEGTGIGALQARNPSYTGAASGGGKVKEDPGMFPETRKMFASIPSLPGARKVAGTERERLRGRAAKLQGAFGNQEQRELSLINQSQEAEGLPTFNSLAEAQEAIEQPVEKQEAYDEEHGQQTVEPDGSITTQASIPDTAVGSATQQITQGRVDEIASRYNDDPIHYDNEKPFYQTSAFNSALMTFMLGQVMGYDERQSLLAAGNAYVTQSGISKRTSYKDQLIRGGYEPQAVEQWIATGDNKDLGDKTTFKLTQVSAPSKTFGGLWQDNFGNVYDAAAMQKAGYGAGVAGDAGGISAMGGGGSEYQVKSQGAAMASLAEERIFDSAATQDIDWNTMDVLDMATHQYGKEPSTWGLLKKKGAYGAMNQATQNYYDATSHWIEGNLRLKSGAAINASEYAKYRDMYFPRAGESASGIEMKRRRRQMINMINLNASGGVGGQVIDMVGRGQWTPTMMNGQLAMVDNSGRVVGIVQ